MPIFYNFLQQIPPMTRAILITGVSLSVLVSFDFIPYTQLNLNWEQIFKHHQYWRIFTSLLFIGELNHFGTIISVWYLSRILSNLEEHHFRGNSADFTYFLILTGLTHVAIGLLLGMNFIFENWQITLIYLWGRNSPNRIFLILILPPIPAPYFPYCMALIHVLIGESILGMAFGILIGHTYYFFHSVFPRLPLTKGKQPLRTPRCFEKLMTLINIQTDQERQMMNQFNGDDLFLQEGENIQLL